jgi:hypothetical protein
MSEETCIRAYKPSDIGSPTFLNWRPVRTLQEVADIMGIHYQHVHSYEKSAMKKLRKHPLMKRLWAEINEGL